METAFKYEIYSPAIVFLHNQPIYIKYDNAVFFVCEHMYNEKIILHLHIC